jgi:RNA polymerase sigma factor (sigma-70 family)
VTLIADDADLIQSITEGDTESLSALYERYFDQVYDLAMRTVRNSEVAADIVQNTFLKAWEALGKGQTPVNFKAWLFTIARNLAIDEMRRKKHFAEPQQASTEADAEPDIFEQIDQDRFADPASAIEDKEMVSLVWQCAASLSPKDYSLLDLHLRQGLSADELLRACRCQREVCIRGSRVYAIH